jgi:DNA (cytosine-5)-methyltransferase 1
MYIEMEPIIYSAISLFSGLGGDSLGLKQAGCNVIAYNELKPVFCKSHEANFPESKLISSEATVGSSKATLGSSKATLGSSKAIHDISKLDDSCFEKYKDKTDILFAGFPCQGFSNAGKKKEDDPRNTLFREFLRVATIVKPYLIIGENVKGLLTKQTSNNESYIDVIVQEFEKIGYKTVFQVLKAEQFNVPQSRERLIIVGVRENPYGWTPSFPAPLSNRLNLINIVKYDMTGAYKVDSSWFDKIPSECILTDLNDTNAYSTNNGAHPYLVSKLTADEAGRFYSGKQHEILFSFGKRDSPIHCEIIDIRKPSKTIICTYEHQPRLFVPLKNASGCYLRMLLPSELKQIQGFPPDYVVCGTVKEQIIQIGNAVPPPLIRAVVEHVTNNFI